MRKKSKDLEFNDHWNSQAKYWAENIRSGKDVFRDLFSLPAFLTFIGNIKGKKVLDVGCGEGYNTRRLAKKGASIVGVDLSEEMIRLAKLEEKKKQLGITYFNASWTDLSCFKAKSFDIVVSTLALMDGPGYEEALKEFYRLLKPRGKLFISIIHPCFITPGYSKVEDEKGIYVGRVVCNYFKEGSWKFSWQLSKKADKSDAQLFTSMSYHRTLSTYLNGLLKAGFLLKEIREPQPSEKACRQNPRLKVARDVTASFLFFHAVKPT